MRSYATLYFEEFRRHLILAKRYWVNELSATVSIFLFFLLVVYSGSALSGQPLSEESKGAALVGMMMWQLSLGCLNMFGWSFYNEAATGTLEHLCLSPLGVLNIFIARSIVTFTWSVLQMLVSAGLAIMLVGVRLELRPMEVFLILPLSVAGVYGFGLLFAALTLTFKRTQQLTNLFQFFFLFFSGSLIPLASLHWTIRAVSRWVPLTSGIEALRRVLIDGASLWSLNGQLLGIGLNSALWIALGVVAYRLAEHRARKLGTVGQY